MAIPQMEQQFLLTNEAREISRKSHSLHRQSIQLSSQEKEERSQPFLEVDLISVCSFYAKLLVWGNREWEKMLGLTLNFTKYICSVFSFMVLLSNRVGVSCLSMNTGI